MRVDFIRWGLLLIPPIMRRPIQAHIIRCCVGEIKKVYDDFLIWKGSVSLRLSRNGQLNKLQGMLNALFFQDNNIIRIEEPEKLTVLVFDRIANRSLIIKGRAENSFVIPKRGDSCIDEYDFSVIVPTTTEETTIELITAMVQNYKLVGKRFIVTRR